MELSESASRILRALLEARTGQQLSLSRRWRLVTALTPLMNARGISSFDALIAALAAGGDTRLADDVVEALLNNETFFYRDRSAFDLLLQGALPRLAAARAERKKLSIWCAGCSSGQEAYSLAMSFAEAKQWDEWQIDILATDVSPSAIERARAGLYSQFEVQRGLPVMQMLRWFEEAGGQQWRISPKLRSAVRFEVHSLTEEPPQGRAFDIILCRNVLLYFPAATIGQVLARLAGAAADDACLMLGAGETIIGQTDAFVSDPDNRGLYVRRPLPEPSRLRRRAAG